MARSRPHGRSKSDHRVCQAARYARAAEYRERISISAEQQEARIAAVNAECSVEDAPRRRRRRKSRELKTKAGAARVSAGGRSCNSSGSVKKKATKRLEHALGKAAKRDPHTLHCHMCGATAEFGLRGSKEGGNVKYSCGRHATGSGCFRVDKERKAWAEDWELRRLRREERRLEEELRQLAGTSSAAKAASARNEFPTTGGWGSMHMSQALIATLLMIGGVERNPGPPKEEPTTAYPSSVDEAYSKLKELFPDATQRGLVKGKLLDLSDEKVLRIFRDEDDAIRATLSTLAGAGPLTSGDPAKGQLQGARLRISGTGEWSPAIADAIRQALDPTFRLLDSQGSLPIPCWTPPVSHPQAAHISRLAIPQWRGEPSLLLHGLPVEGKGKGRSAADRLITFILNTRARFGVSQTQLGRATFGLGVSGCGKTRTALEALCAGYGFYLSFTNAEEPASRILKTAVERFRQRFQKQLEDLKGAGKEEDLQIYRTGRLDDALKLVVRILLVEVLCLERFLANPAATPRKFLMMQLIGLGGLEDWVVDAWSCVFDVSLEELTKELQRAVGSVKQLSGQGFLLVVVDEAHLGLKSLEGHFPNAENTQGRSLLNAWVRSLDNPAFKGFHFLFTGTRLGIAEHDSLATAIGKGPGVPVIYSDYGINSTSQARSFALEYVPGGDCEENLWELVAGRYRFAVELAKLRLAGASLNWEGAANALKKRHTEDASTERTLVGRLTALKSKSKFYKNILHSLKVLVTDRYVMGVARAQYRKNLDLVELGFCHLVQVTDCEGDEEEEEGGIQVMDSEGDENEEEGGAEIDESKGLWRMDMSEPLAAVAAKVYLERRGGWKQDSVVERLMLKLDLPSPIGLLWDVYMPTALRKFFTPDKKLADHPLLKSIKGRLPASFFTHPQIVCLTKDGTVNKVTDREGYKVRRGNEGFRFVDFAEDPRSITSFLPEDGAGPDVAHFVQLGEAEKENWFDILQAKLRPDYDLEHALKTVTLDLLYSGHPDREQLVARVKSALQEKRVKGVIRFVAAFPSTKTATTEVFHPEESKTRKEDMCTVQIGVSAENAHHFFEEEHLEILRSLKDAKKRAYSEIE